MLRPSLTLACYQTIVWSSFSIEVSLCIPENLSMSSVAVNDENDGICPGRKHSNSETSCDIFSLDQPTGRPSILRLSQAENLSSKTIAKGGKVCFQTPRRDPFTKRIVSPTKSLKMQTLDDECLQLSAVEVVLPQINLTKSGGSSYPDDDMPIHSKGGYQLDFDNLDTINPFQASAKIVLSPKRSELVEPPKNTEHNAIESISAERIVESGKIELALDETLPFIPSVENSFADMSATMHSTDSGVITILKDPGNELSISALDELVRSSFHLHDEEAGAAFSTAGGEEAGAASSTAGGEEAGAASTTAGGEEAGAASTTAGGEEAGAASTTAGGEEAGAASTTAGGEEAGAASSTAGGEEAGAASSTAGGEEAGAASSTAGGEEAGAASSTAGGEEVNLLSEGSYKFDFDDLDSINPFQTGGIKVQNSPMLERMLPGNDSPPELEVEDPAIAVKTDLAATVLGGEQVLEILPKSESKPALDEMSKPAEDSVLQRTSDLLSDGPVKLEFNFDDGKVKRKPPKKFGKRTVGVKLTEKPAVLVEKRDPPALTKDSPVKSVFNRDSGLPVSNGSVDVDSKFDDPNFNPFGANAKMGNSPGCKVKSSPEVKAPTTELVNRASEDCGDPFQIDTALIPCDRPPAEGNSRTDAALSATSEGSDQKLQVSCEVKVPSSVKEDLPTRPDFPSLSPPEPLDPSQLEQNPETTKPDFETFVPGSTFLADDFDGQMDYLEQFGSSNFKESALRKQSLYLKFDPLLRESPKKSGAPAGLMNHLRTASFASRIEVQKNGAMEVANELKLDDSRILDVPPLVHTFSSSTPLVQNSTVFENLLVGGNLGSNTEDNIIEVLKYSQQDMDAAIGKIQEETKVKEAEWKAKHDKLSLDNHEMGKIMSEFEATISQILAEKQREKMAAQAEISKVLQEKEQVSQDLSSMERSFSDLFKRLEKYKEVMEGYKQNEEMLKKCAQDYLARIKKEEQRYQTLKAHAEQKISLANKEIADVRSKLKSEVSALQAQLRREQLRAQSLENSLDQKVKEAEELTSLCDELIAKVQKG
ncbi:hypothetical protein UPYG_G00222110 [Umbra pygmaea]|uniref:Transforming acidic coiled-coil-containing protein C-terminal domain-containing protein n=1 Tax=Umbra pygmaea TaxID=75934 RepID=A0ABD0WBP6_UMBPY